MSTPANRLASFRSYSYYHVLTVSDCTDTAEELARSTDMGVWEHANRSTAYSDFGQLGRFAVKELSSGGKYAVLINGSTDASCTIETAKWITSTGADAVPGDRGISLATEGSLIITEPKGVSFLDNMIKCAIALGVDSANAIYSLKTFFIGFGDEGGETVGLEGDTFHMISDIPPINFIVSDVTGSFTEAGGIYNVEWVCIANGVTRLPQYSKAVNAMQVTAGSTLAATFKNLEDKLNSDYDRYFHCVKTQLESTEGATPEYVESLRKVKYIIETGAAYRDPAYTVTDQPVQFKNGAGCADAASFTFPPHTSIETALNTIMTMSVQVKKDMAVGDSATGAKFEYKIQTALISSRDADGKISFTVKYKIDRFRTPNSITYEPGFGVFHKDEAELQANTESYEQLMRNVIEFDYIYTGKNVDILEFDIKVNSGLAYLQIATLANTFKGQLEPASARLTQPSNADNNRYKVRFASTEEELSKPMSIPVFFGSQIRSPGMTNQAAGGDTIQSAFTMTKHSSLEVQDSSMKIMGNTQLLWSTNNASLIENAVGTEDGVEVMGDSRQLYEDWTKVPTYAKVNVKMPRNNDDFALASGQSIDSDDGDSQEYTKNFWFDGYYYVFGIEHEFTNGLFTQTLEMIGVPKSSALKSVEERATSEASIKSGVEGCYDNAIGFSVEPESADTSTNGETTTNKASDATPTPADGKPPAEDANSPDSPDTPNPTGEGNTTVIPAPPLTKENATRAKKAPFDPKTAAAGAAKKPQSKVIPGSNSYSTDGASAPKGVALNYFINTAKEGKRGAVGPSEFQHELPGNIRMLAPAEGIGVSPRYMRTINGVRKIHRGHDISAPLGTPIYAASAGRISQKAFQAGGGGNWLEIDHGFGVRTKYMHCSKILVNKGQQVIAGQRIAEVGNTGHSYGPHVHFEVWVNGDHIDPTFVIPQLSRQKGSKSSLTPGRSYDGVPSGWDPEQVVSEPEQNVKSSSRTAKSNLAATRDAAVSGDGTSSPCTESPPSASVAQPVAAISKTPPAMNTPSAVQDTNLRAFLDTIAVSEGTYGKGDNGYNIMFGGKTFGSYAAHPRVRHKFGKSSTTAAGRYQFMVDTWDEFSRKLSLKDFSPASQDTAAIELVKRRKAYGAVLAGQFDKAIALCANEWASFPGNSYGQPKHNIQYLRDVYAKAGGKFAP